MHRTSFRFAHHRLEAYQVSRQLAERARRASERVPRGYRSFADQLLRAAGNTVALIGEGANRFTAGQKRQRFSEARGECGEVACLVELLADFGFLPEAEAVAMLTLADRVCAMLTRLIQRHS